MGLEDDRDMKIAGDDFEPVNEAGADVGHEAQLLEQEKENGNLSRARRLGAILADEVSAVEGDSRTDDSALLTQRRILLSFAVEVGLDALLPNSLTAQTAQDIFYNSLRVTAPRFYDDLQASGAFSFYYLCVRDGRQVGKRWGKPSHPSAARRMTPPTPVWGRSCSVGSPARCEISWTRWSLYAYKKNRARCKIEDFATRL